MTARLIPVIILLGVIPFGSAAAQSRDGGTMRPEGEAFRATFPENANNLLPNGGFDDANEIGDGPAHWQQPDGLVVHWTHDPGAPDRGRVIRINTDVYQRQTYRWWVDRYVNGAALDRAPPRQPTSGNRYDTIAGLDGGFYWSDPIPVREGGAYRVFVDARGPKAKVFIRGYEERPETSFGDEAPAVQEVFRNARGEPTLDEHGRPIRYRLRYRYTTWFTVGGDAAWQTYSHAQPRHPNNRDITENVRWIRIMLYPYWPPGEYWFDNIRVIEADPQTSPVEGADPADLEEGKVIR